MSEMNVTIVSDTVLRVGIYEVDLTICTRSALVKALRIILVVFKEGAKQKHVGSQFRLLQRLGDLGDLELVETEMLRKHIIYFTRLWFPNARDTRSLGDLKVQQLTAGTNNVGVKPSYESKVASKDNKVLINSQGGLVLQGSADDDAAYSNRIKTLREKITALQTSVAACTAVEADACDTAKKEVAEALVLAK